MDMDIGTGLTMVGGAFLSKDLLIRLLGPTADYLGGGLRNYTQKGMENLGRVFGHAAKTLGAKLEEPGQVPPKVLKGVLEEGYYCEDELTAQYFGGVLASSRSGVSRDDRGSSFITLIGRLSTYQIRTHYIFYTVFKHVCNGREGNLGLSEERDKLKLFIPFAIFVQAMDFQQGEVPNILIPHILNGLHREGLIGETWASGNPEVLKKAMHIDAEYAGILFLPSAVGMELFLWAHGLSTVAIKDFLTAGFQPMQLEGMILPEGGKCYAPPSQ